MPSDPSPKSGRRAVRLGKYEVLAHVATGGMGVVYRARDTELGREVALKIIQPEMAAKPHLLERFRREARHAARLRHENIVAIYEYGEHHTTHFLALEYVEGTDLGDYIDQRGKLDPDEAREITLQAAHALAHAHKHGVVHRDIKPSNFLLTHVEAPSGIGSETRLLVKLADFGLARTEGDEDYKVTREGSTVGTIDYIAPEQARNSGSADIRSDIYALGCSFFHMLAGQPPFPDGSLTERLLKHLEAPPPNVRDCNPRVSESLAAIVRKMLAKKPDDRYQTPAELIAALTGVETVAPISTDRSRDVLAGLAQEEKTPRPARKPSSSTERRAQTSRPQSTPVRSPLPAPRTRSRSSQDTRDNVSAATRPMPAPVPPAEQRRPAVPWVVLGILGVAVAVAVLAGVLSLSGKRPDRSGSTVAGSGSTHQEQPIVLVTHPGTAPEIKATASVRPDPSTSSLSYLYRGATVVDAEPLRREVTAPWSATSPADAPIVLRLARTPRGEQSFDSLWAACAAAPEGRTTVIEIHDNGPLFQAPATVSGRNLVLRAGKGYRPLLVWDLPATRPDAGARMQTWLTVNGGSLTLEGIDVAVECADSGQPMGLFRVTDGDLTARDCSFSVAGRHRSGVPAIWLGRTRAGPPVRCRLTHCIGRGGSLVALDVPAGGTEALVEGCLLAGGEYPLLRVGSRTVAVTDSPTVLRVVRSTLAAGSTLLEARLPEDGRATVLRFFGWDALLARSGGPSGGELLSLPDGSSGRVEWRAINCLYAGWKVLVSGRTRITDLEGWRRQVQKVEGDAVESKAWPAAGVPDLAEVLPEVYRPEGPVAFTATSGPGPLGCDLERLPPVRDGWQGLTVRRFAGSVPDLPAARAPPEVPVSPDGTYHGERIDLDKVRDLGAHLRQVQQERKLGRKVVLRLSGSGEKPTSPFRLQGSSLVLYFEPPADKKLPPLTLLAPGTAAGQDGLIEVEDGDLEMINGSIRFEDFPSALLPPYVLRVRGGDLRLFGCRLEGPLRQPPEAFRALVRIDGSGRVGRNGITRSLAVSDTVFLSGKSGIHLVGAGVGAVLNESLLFCGTEAIHLEPAAVKSGRLAMVCSLDRCTVAARTAVLRLSDVADVVPLEPAVVQTRSCVFLNPFEASGHNPSPACLLRCEGESLNRGLLVCQSEADVYDRRLHGLTVQAQPGPHLLWRRLWGSYNVSQPVIDLDFKCIAELNRAHLDRLVLPSTAQFLRPPGADLVRLGILKKSRP